MKDTKIVCDYCHTRLFAGYKLPVYWPTKDSMYEFVEICAYCLRDKLIDIKQFIPYDKQVEIGDDLWKF